MLGLSLAGPAVGAPTPLKRLALVIGNSSYPAEIGELANPGNDVDDITKKLIELKFDVTVLKNASNGQMTAALDAFSQSMTADTVALFYYGGHGVAVNGWNYLLPVDTPKTIFADTETDMTNTLGGALVPLDSILLRLQKAKIGLLFLDSCRSAPGEGGRGGGLDLRVGTRAVPIIRGNIKSASSAANSAGTFRAYATDPGNVARDGTGRNSPFAAALVRHIATAGITIDEVMRRVRAQVIKETGNKQTPWSEDLLLEQFFLNVPIAIPRPVASSTNDEPAPKGRPQEPSSGGRKPSGSSGSGGGNGGGNTKQSGPPPGLGFGVGGGL